MRVLGVLYRMASQDVKFACVTVPYWDWGEWQFYCNSDPAGCKTCGCPPLVIGWHPGHWWCPGLACDWVVTLL